MLRWLAILIGLAAGYLAFAHFSGGAFPTFGLPIGGDSAFIRRATTSFMEDLQFKDFDKAASYHAPETRDDVDIPYLIQRIFVQKPESLDIMSYEILFTDIDSTGLRARVKVRVKVKSLVTEGIKDQELMLFFNRANDAAPWYMELESSLRNDNPDKGKKS